MRRLFRHIACIVLLVIGSNVRAQQEFTLYHMTNIFQSSYVNPVGVPEHGISLSLPGISSIYAGAANTGFTVKSAFDGNVLDLDQVVSDLKKVNYITTGLSYDILGFRFKVHNYNISLSIRDILDFRFAYPRDIMVLATQGNGAFIGKEGDWDKLRIHGNYYRDIGLGYAYHDPHSKWYYGGRLRFLFGIANISTRKSKSTFTTSDETYDLMLQSKIRINTSGYQTAFEQDGYIDDNKEQLAKDYLLNFKNFGIGLDAGVSYQFSKKVNLEANVKDLGFINWKTNPRNYEIDGTFEFAGLELKDYSTVDTMKYFLENLPDSLEKLFAVQESQEKYSAPLIAQTYLTANYQVLPHTRLSGTLFTEFFHGVQPGLFFGVTQNVGRAFDFTLTYSGFRNSWNNLGFGFSVKPGPIQFYMVSDNILGPLIWAKVEGTTVPYNLKSSNLRFGFNVLIGKVREPDLQTTPK